MLHVCSGSDSWTVLTEDVDILYDASLGPTYPRVHRGGWECPSTLHLLPPQPLLRNGQHCCTGSCGRCIWTGGSACPKKRPGIICDSSHYTGSVLLFVTRCKTLYYITSYIKFKRLEMTQMTHPNEGNKHFKSCRTSCEFSLIPCTEGTNQTLHQQNSLTQKSFSGQHRLSFRDDHGQQQVQSRTFDVLNCHLDKSNLKLLHWVKEVLSS